MLPLGEPATWTRRLTEAGLGLMIFGDQVSVGFVRFGSPAERLGLESGSQVTAVFVPADRPAPEWFFVPALLLLAIVARNQQHRKTH
jgi:hypothetical protein